MTEPSKEAPFDDENWTAYRNESGQVIASWRSHAAQIFSREAVTMCHAFIESERDTWCADGDSLFRKGRWTVELEEDGSYRHFGHDDIPAEAWTWNSGRWDHATPNAVRKVGASFHAWLDAQTPSPEPMTEPTQRFSVVTASVTNDTTRREFVRLGGGIWADEDSGTPYIREMFSWSNLIDPEPYLPDGV